MLFIMEKDNSNKIPGGLGSSDSEMGATKRLSDSEGSESPELNSKVINESSAGFNHFDSKAGGLRESNTHKLEDLGHSFEIQNGHLSSDNSFLDSSPHLSPEPVVEMATEPLEPKHEHKSSNGKSASIERSDSTNLQKSKPISRAVPKAYLFQLPRRPAMTRDELKQCSSILKALRRHPDAGPFLEPVDIKKLNIPDYPTIIKYPMDLDTAEKKLNVCAYDMVDEFFADIQKIFDNCYLYNGNDAPISKMAQNLEVRFNKFKKDFSHASEILEQESAPPSAQRLHSLSKPPKSKSKQSSRKTSQSQILPMESSKTYNSLSSSKRPGSRRTMSDLHLKFCASVLKELHKKHHLRYSFPFLEPVDWKSMNLPDYPLIVREPMDLSTIKKKFEDGVYPTAFDFESDVRLMFKNCYLYNPPTGQVHVMGKQLEDVFENKWKQRPTDLWPNSQNDGLSSGDSSSSEESPVPVKTHSRKNSRKPSKTDITPPHRVEKISKHESKGRKRKDHPDLVAPVTEIPIPRQPSTKASKPRKDSVSKPKKAPGITYEQKKELSQAINNLSGEVLNVVVDLIHRSMPEIGRSQSEIELDIDSLDPNTLSKLYSYVMSATSAKHPPARPHKTKSKSRTSKSLEPEPRRSRELKSSHKAGRHTESSKSSRHGSKHQASVSSSSSSSSGSESGSGTDSDSDSSALSKPKHSSRVPSKTRLPGKERSTIKNPPSQAYLAEKIPSVLPKAKRIVKDAEKTPVKPTPKSESSPFQKKSASETSLSPKKQDYQPNSIVNDSLAKLQARIKEESERYEAKRNRPNSDILLEQRIRMEKKQQREDEQARVIARKKKEREEEAAILAEEAQKLREARGARRIDLLHQSRTMRYYGERLANHKPDQNQARGTIPNGQPVPSKKEFSSPSSLSPSVIPPPPLPTQPPPPPPINPPTSEGNISGLEDGELEEGELLE